VQRDRLYRAGINDTLPLYVAVAACELFGAVATLGRMPNLNDRPGADDPNAGCGSE
jgi:hypothetical protein